MHALTLDKLNGTVQFYNRQCLHIVAKPHPSLHRNISSENVCCCLNKCCVNKFVPMTMLGRLGHKVF